MKRKRQQVKFKAKRKSEFFYCLYTQPCYPAQLQRSFCPFFCPLAHSTPSIPMVRLLSWIPLVSPIVCSSPCTITDYTSAMLSHSLKFSELYHVVTPLCVIPASIFVVLRLYFTGMGDFQGPGLALSSKRRGVLLTFCVKNDIYILKNV